MPSSRSWCTRSQTPTFWLLLHAVRAFVSHPTNPSRLLPLSGALPDMKASSSGYVELQTLYKHKAREDLALVRDLLGETLDRVGLDRASVGDDEVETFVKHAAWLKVVRGRSLRMEHEACALKGQIGASVVSLGLCGLSRSKERRSRCMDSNQSTDVHFSYVRRRPPLVGLVPAAARRVPLHLHGPARREPLHGRARALARA